jgi:hypothetical protein
LEKSNANFEIITQTQWPVRTALACEIVRKAFPEEL